MKYIIILSFSFLLFSQAFGQVQPKHKIDQELEQCIEENGSTQGMVSCTMNAEKKWDNELNKYYKLLLSKLDSTGQSALRESQRQWLLFRQKETTFYMKVYGSNEGTMWRIIIADKHMGLIKQRAVELTEYYEMLTQH